MHPAGEVVRGPSPAPPSLRLLANVDAVRRGSGSCPICSRPGGRPADILAELSASWVTAPIEAPLPGYVCVVAKRHVAEPFELTTDESAAFWGDCMTVARALSALVQPTKMNYEIHGNTIPHLHMHLYPRYPGDPYEGRTIDNTPIFTRTPSDIAGIRRALSDLSDEHLDARS
jgi:diadenosine tetraphosphate (Ap4A) HIT family hydrolase